MMTRNDVSFANIVFFTIVIAEVTPWTIDLPEIRRHVFEKNEMEKKGYKDYVDRERPFYSNVNGNSQHNAKDYVDGYDNLKYDDENEYQSHMEKKVASIVHDGSLYLEGLRRAIESYADLLENCTRNNITADQINSIANSTWRPQIPALPTGNMTTGNVTTSNQTLAIGNRTSCQQVTRAGEHVRRLAELAMWATRRLQDLAYAEPYQKDVASEEDELIFKLAWFLDRLAHLTGYEPNHNEFIPDTVTTKTPAPLISPPVPMPVMDTPEDVKNSLMNCLEQNSTEPATTRCAYPVPIPPMVAMVHNMTENNRRSASSTSSSDVTEASTSSADVTETSTSSPNVIETSTSSPDVIEASTSSSDVTEGVSAIALEPTPEQSSLELLIAVDDRRPLSKISQTRQNLNEDTPMPELSHLTAVKSVKKRSIDENPTIKLMKYYVKHKVWIKSNPTTNNIVQSNNDFDVKSGLTAAKSIRKRSLINKKYTYMRLPENPSQDISKYLKSKPGVSYNKDKNQSDLIKKELSKMRDGMSMIAKDGIKKKFSHLTKRSVHYEKMYLPRNPEDPTGDISYYVKNKPGTDLNANLAQSLQVRLGLEQHFQTGNIETVRRYGANYNPLIPAPFYFGIIRSIADS